MGAQSDPLLTLAIDKDDFVFTCAEEVPDDKVVGVAVEGLPTFVEEKRRVGFKL